MRNCPKCKKISQTDDECDKCGVLFKDIKRKDEPEPRVARAGCGWNGCMRESLPRVRTPYGWLNLCAPHYEQYWLVVPRDKSDPNGHVNSKLLPPDENDSYRRRWYSEKGLPFEPAKRVESNLAHWTAIHGFGPKQREPGEDEDYVHAG